MVEILESKGTLGEFMSIFKACDLSKNDEGSFPAAYAFIHKINPLVQTHSVPNNTTIHFITFIFIVHASSTVIQSDSDTSVLYIPGEKLEGVEENVEKHSTDGLQFRMEMHLYGMVEFRKETSSSKASDFGQSITTGQKSRMLKSRNI
ncbi:hypothetical protein H5410_055409, partial [Solanum commersonii]